MVNPPGDAFSADVSAETSQPYEVLIEWKSLHGCESLEGHP